MHNECLHIKEFKLLVFRRQQKVFARIDQKIIMQYAKALGQNLDF